MGRRKRMTNTRAIEPGGHLARWLVERSARALVAAVLLCACGVPGWAGQADPQKPQAGQPKQQAGQQKPPSDAQRPQGDPQKQQSDQQQMRGLDEQVQEIKTDVLGIAQELSRLEEKLLYPSGTQLAIFVALAPGDSMRLDAVRLQIDGQLVADYIYSFKELEALRKGGVQRIYVGNVATGDHQLEVLVGGKLEGGADFSRTEHFTFRKEVKPKLVELKLAGAGSGNAPIALSEF